MSIDLHSLPNGSRPENAIRNNGPDNLVLERYKLRELAEGWPMYRCVPTWDCSRPSITDAGEYEFEFEPDQPQRRL